MSKIPKDNREIEPFNICWKKEAERLQAENKKLNIILFHRENGLSHPDLQVEIDKSKFMELQAELKTAKTERNILAMLSADSPQFFNPTGIFEAKQLRDRILKGQECIYRAIT